jgi:hypothetical protein
VPSQPRRRKRAGREPEQIIRDLGELTEGAPIVHEDHGVGRYRGLVTLEAGGTPGEYLEIEYAKGDRLYVPVAQLDRISRYSGASAETAPLHSLGGEQWTKAKRKAAEKVRDVAAELLEIQAKRQARAGLALDLDRAMYEPFAATFPFEETPDQHAAIESVIRDLASSQPMDRVVCGDVGFGKTEVAVRAAFVAAAAGKQVAVLVPTTLLAEQHYRNFRDRFADWPIKVEVLSRFKSTKEIKSEIDKLAEGQDRRHRRHASPAAGRRALQGPGPGDRRRGTALRRAPEGSAEGAARERAPAHADRHAHSAHAQHGDGGLARSVDHRHAARAPPRGADLRHAVGRRACCARRTSANSRAAARCTSCTTTSKPSRACSATCRNWCPRRASASRTARCPSANWNA